MTDPYRIRSAETWAQARDDYLAGLDAEAVCRRHDLGLSAFRRRARKYGWRRIDQDDPAPDVLDLSVYEDVGPDDQVRTAYLRFVRALELGRAVEAARWRRLWRELVAERNATDAEVFPGLDRAEIAGLLAAEAAAEEDEDEALLLAAPPRAAALPAPEGTATAAEKVHDVHSAFSSAHFPAAGSAPPGDPPPDALPGLEHRHPQRRRAQPERPLGADARRHGEGQPPAPVQIQREGGRQADPAREGDHADDRGERQQHPASLAQGPARRRGDGAGVGVDGHGGNSFENLASMLKVPSASGVFHPGGVISRRSG